MARGSELQTFGESDVQEKASSITSVLLLGPQAATRVLSPQRPGSMARFSTRASALLALKLHLFPRPAGLDVKTHTRTLRHMQSIKLCTVYICTHKPAKMEESYHHRQSAFLAFVDVAI